MKKIIILLIFFTLEIYAQSWDVIGSMPKPVYGGAAVVQDSLIYIIGGFNYKNNLPTKLIQSYNPRTGEWKEAGQLKNPRYGLIAGEDSDSVIIAGGMNTSPVQSSGSIEMWNYSSEPVIYNDNSNFERSFATAQIVGDDLFIFGGVSMKISLPYAVVYNIPQKKIIFTSDTLFHGTFLLKQTSFKVGKYIYVLGGIIVGTTGVTLNKIYKFNTETFKFEEDTEELPKSLAAAKAVTFDKNHIYIIGGFNETHPVLSDVKILTFENDDMEISEGPSLNFPRKELMAVRYGGAIYVFGGLNAENQPVKSIEKLDIITGIKEQTSRTPQKFELNNNYPNPFNPSTQISFKIAKNTHASLRIYSIMGKLVKTITSGEFSPGKYKFEWNGTDQSGRKAASGVYIYRLSTNYFSDSKKMILLK